MKKTLLTLAFGLLSSFLLAQNEEKVFRAYLFNKEYDVYLRIDFYNESISVPGNELYGKLHGYLGKNNNSFCWPITAAVRRVSGRVLPHRWTSAWTCATMSSITLAATAAMAARA